MTPYFKFFGKLLYFIELLNIYVRNFTTELFIFFMISVDNPVSSYFPDFNFLMHLFISASVQAENTNGSCENDCSLFYIQ